MVFHGDFFEGSWIVIRREGSKNTIGSSFQSHHMTNRQPGQSLIDPVAESKMPLCEETTASAGLSNPGSTSVCLSKHNGAYLYGSEDKDRAGFSQVWTKSKTCVLDGRSPVGDRSSMEGQKHWLDKTTEEQRHSAPPSVCRTPGNQGFPYPTRSPDINSSFTTVPHSDRKQGGLSDNSYLSLPKQMYQHGCNTGCYLTHRCRVEQELPRIPNTAYDGQWMHTGTHFSHLSPIHGRAPDVLIQPRAEGPIRKDIHMEKYDCLSPNRQRTLPAYFKTNYSSYPCVPAQTLFRSLPDQNQHLQTSPKDYPGMLLSSSSTYEHVNSLQHGIPLHVYQDHSPMSKYGQLPQHHVLYYPQANVGVQNVTICQDNGRHAIPDCPKHTFSYPQEHYRHSDVPVAGIVTSPHHPYLRGFEQPCYPIHRPYLNSSPPRVSLKRPHAALGMHPSGLIASPSGVYMDEPHAFSSNVCVDQPTASLHGHCSHSFPACINDDHSRGSPTGFFVERPRAFVPFASLYKSPHSPSAARLNTARAGDYSHRNAPGTCPKQLKADAGTEVVLSQSPTRSKDRISKADHCSASCSPEAPKRARHHSPSAAGTNDCKGNSKKRISQMRVDHTSQAITIKEEKIDDFEIDKPKKLAEASRVSYSPPMPVIDNVFSFAPYQAHLEGFGLWLPGKMLQMIDHSAKSREIKLEPGLTENAPVREEQPDDCVSPEDITLKIISDTESLVVDALEHKKIKSEKSEPEGCLERCVESSVGHCENNMADGRTTVKDEDDGHCSSDSELITVTKTSEPDKIETEALTVVKDEASVETKIDQAKMDVHFPLSTQNRTKNTQPTFQKTDVPNQMSSKSGIPAQPPENKLNIPTYCLKLSNDKINLPDTLHPKLLLTPAKVHCPLAEATTKTELKIPVRQRFLELHCSLCKLVSGFVSMSPEAELRTWLSYLKMTEPASSSTKTQKVSCLLGPNVREAWLREETRTPFQNVLQRLKEYISQERCPFPHVIRAGTVFIPMLVVKELLFPQVQGSFIDQVLQEHKVTLRPTTLSEEKLLTQLHKRSCSSKLRRLLALKHLPAIYSDVINLFYHQCVCIHLAADSEHALAYKRHMHGRELVFMTSRKERDKEQHPFLATHLSTRISMHTEHRHFLGVELNESGERELDQSTESSRNQSPTYSEIITDSTQSGLVCSDSQSHKKDQHVGKRKTKGRVKSSSRRMFLDECTLSEEEVDCTQKAAAKWVTVSHTEQQRNSRNGKGIAGEETGHRGEEGDATPIGPQKDDTENSWTRPLSADELPSSSSDTEMEGACSSARINLPVGSDRSQARSRKRSGMILKLRRVLLSKPHHQAASRTGCEPSADGEITDTSERDCQRKVSHRWQRIEGLSRAIRPLTSSSKRRRRSLLKIKYCPYLSACHSAEHRRRWVLRSAVQRAQLAMKFCYPDLVGKTIYHLYEEDDKSEVWYKGEVLRVHEAHPNPVKTVFEVQYDSEPGWKYYLELLIDYKKGWLKIED